MGHPYSRKDYCASQTFILKKISALFALLEFVSKAEDRVILFFRTMQCMQEGAEGGFVV